MSTFFEKFIKGSTVTGMSVCNYGTLSKETGTPEYYAKGWMITYSNGYKTVGGGGGGINGNDFFELLIVSPENKIIEEYEETC